MREDKGEKKNKLTAQEETRKKKENWTGIQKEILAIYSILQKKKKARIMPTKKAKTIKKKGGCRDDRNEQKEPRHQKSEGFPTQEKQMNIKKNPSIIQLDMSSSIKRCACF